MTNSISQSRNSTISSTFYFLRGRVALCAILRALNLRAGDEVLLQAFTCLAVPNPIVGLGLKPVYVDVDHRTCNMNPDSLQERITSRSRVILVQHTFGIPAPMKAILSLARKHELVVVEDCCHVLGSRLDGQELGSFGDASFYSYEWGKPIVIGIGGAAVIHRDSLLKSVASRYPDYRPPRASDVAVVNLQYVAHSLLRRPALFWTVREIYRFVSKSGLIVSSFRKEEFECKLNIEYEMRMADRLRQRLHAKSVPTRIAQSIQHRIELGHKYEEFMRELGLEMARPPAGSETVYLRFPLFVRNKSAVLARARKSHIEMGDWFSSAVHPLSRTQLAVAGYTNGSCPVAERLGNTVVTLPVSDMIGLRDAEKTLHLLNTIAHEELLDARSAESSDQSRGLHFGPGVLQ
jgi:perosamine synthetase